MDWLSKNYQWVFSGVGVALIGSIFFAKSRSKSRSVSQSAKKSKNVTQVGGDVSIGSEDDQSKRK